MVDTYCSHILPKGCICMYWGHSILKHNVACWNAVSLLLTLDNFNSAFLLSGRETKQATRITANHNFHMRSPLSLAHPHTHSRTFSLTERLLINLFIAADDGKQVEGLVAKTQHLLCHLFQLHQLHDRNLFSGSHSLIPVEHHIDCNERQYLSCLRLSIQNSVFVCDRKIDKREREKSPWQQSYICHCAPPPRPSATGAADWTQVNRCLSSGGSSAVACSSLSSLQARVRKTETDMSVQNSFQIWTVNEEIWKLVEKIQLSSFLKPSSHSLERLIKIIQSSDKNVSAHLAKIISILDSSLKSFTLSLLFSPTFIDFPQSQTLKCPHCSSLLKERL